MSVASVSRCDLFVQILQTIDVYIVHVCDRIASRKTCGYRRVISDALMHRLTADRARFEDRLLTFRRIHDECDLMILDHIDDVRASFTNLVSGPTRDACVSDGFRRA